MRRWLRMLVGSLVGVVPLLGIGGIAQPTVVSASPPACASPTFWDYRAQREGPSVPWVDSISSIVRVRLGQNCQPSGGHGFIVAVKLSGQYGGAAEVGYRRTSANCTRHFSRTWRQLGDPPQLALGPCVTMGTENLYTLVRENVSGAWRLRAYYGFTLLSTTSWDPHAWWTGPYNAEVGARLTNANSQVPGSSGAPSRARSIKFGFSGAWFDPSSPMTPRVDSWYWVVSNYGSCGAHCFDIWDWRS